MGIKYTIFTPAYNREGYLGRLYKSLKSQSFVDFEWVIVDDGSIDNTRNLVSSYIEEEQISIKYFYQPNSGKHLAINRGLLEASGEFFFIVDSDDYLFTNSLEVINEKVSELDNAGIGVVGRKVTEELLIVGDSFPKSDFYSDHIDFVYIKGIKGDMAEVVKTSILKNYMFPVFEGERFCAEGLLWNRLAKKYKMLFFDEPIYVCEYLDNGLSANSIKNRRLSSNYSTLIYKELLDDKRLTIVIKIRTIINFWRFSFFNKKGFIQNWKNLGFDLLSLLIFPFGYLMKTYDSYKVKSNLKR